MPRAALHAGVLRTAHDIRALARCGLCNGWGLRHELLTNLEPAGLVGAFHGRCVVLHLPPDAVLGLPSAERAKLRLNDTGTDLMRRLLAAAD